MVITFISAELKVAQPGHSTQQSCLFTLDYITQKFKRWTCLRRKRNTITNLICSLLTLVKSVGSNKNVKVVFNRSALSRTLQDDVFTGEHGYMLWKDYHKNCLMYATPRKSVDYK